LVTNGSDTEREYGYDQKEAKEMAMIIQSSRLFLGNSSLGIDIAEAL